MFYIYFTSTFEKVEQNSLTNISFETDYEGNWLSGESVENIFPYKNCVGGPLEDEMSDKNITFIMSSKAGISAEYFEGSNYIEYTGNEAATGSSKYFTGTMVLSKRT